LALSLGIESTGKAYIAVHRLYGWESDVEQLLKRITRLPQTVLMILTGDLGHLDPAWRGVAWRGVAGLAAARPQD